MTWIEPIYPAQELQSAGDGPTVHLSAPWNEDGFTGQGVRVGVIDGGFKDFSAHQGTDLPKSVTALCFNRISPGITSDIATCETGSQHGSAVAEAIIDIAPDAELYISNPHTAADLQQAVQWMTDQGVDIINHSIGWGWDGPGDGTSPNSNSPLNSVDAAVAAGILWINAAGNHGHTSWMGPPADQNKNRWMEFSGAEENRLLLSGGDKVGIHLRWDDDWPGASRDLDIYLYDSSGRELSAATSAQTGQPGHKPRETLSYSISRSGTYSIKVKLNGGTLPDWVQMTVWNAAGNLSVNTGGSITNPAESANPGLISVGAANWADTDRINHYSSQGPTPDGRTKPELVGADGGRSEVYNDIFNGTSQAAPHVAGIAALAHQRISNPTPTSVANYLKWTARASGNSSPNNTWGWGFAVLANTDYDSDDDQLIEVSSLQQLDAMRWDPSGDGNYANPLYRTAFPNALPHMSCGHDQCQGYELTEDLDFDTNQDKTVDENDDYWNQGQGWAPLGTATDPFATTLQGNGHAIRNLRVNRAGAIGAGLFAHADSNSRTSNLIVTSADVHAHASAAILIGSNAGVITAVRVSGTVTTEQNSAGGITGHNTGSIQACSAEVDVATTGVDAGGLAGANSGTITTSHSSGEILAGQRVGGLAGNNTGAISASYSNATVEGDDAVGGPAGSNGGTISHAYSTGFVTGSANTGGLLGQSDGTTTVAYWDTETSGQTASAAGAGQTTAELQQPTDYTGIYAAWNINIDGTTGNDDPWHFGSPTDYPTLHSPTGPGAPSDVQATTGPKSITLTWSTAPTNRAPITSYQYQLDEGPWVNIPGGANAGPHTVQELENGVSYSLTVRAVNALGAGQPSASVSATPIGPPDPPSINDIITGTDTIVVSWSEPDQNGGRPVSSYDLRIAPDGANLSTDSAWTTHTQVWTSGDLEYSITPLETRQRYHVQLRAVSSGGASPWSPPGQDHDLDDDGLIEIINLTQLNALRWNTRGPRSNPNPVQNANYAAAFPSAITGRGCTATRCTGYELAADLDFDTNGDGSADDQDAYWNDGQGWNPIGDSTDQFRTTFQGNRHTISNLFINRPLDSHVGLFGYLTRGAEFPA